MKKNEIFVNYVGSLAFVLLVLLFLFSLVFISRSVLSEDSTLNEYVVSTKTLLKDIDEVEKNVNQINETTRFSIYDIKLTSSDFGVIDSSFLNTNLNQSFFSLKFNHTIKEFENYYLLDIDENFDFKKGQVILYNGNEGIVINDETNYLETYNLDDTRMENVLKSDILGVVIYEETQ